MRVVWPDRQVCKFLLVAALLVLDIMRHMRHMRLRRLRVMRGLSLLATIFLQLTRFARKHRSGSDQIVSLGYGYTPS